MQTFLPTKYKLNSLVRFSGKYIYTDEDETPKLRAVRDEAIIELRALILSLLGISLIFFAILVVDTVYFIYYEGAKLDMFVIKLPFVDTDSDIGSFINISCQFIELFFAMISIPAFELMDCFMSNVISTIPRLIRVDFEDIDTEVNLNGFTLKVKSRLRNVFLKIQDHERYAFILSNDLIDFVIITSEIISDLLIP